MTSDPIPSSTTQSADFADLGNTGRTSSFSLKDEVIYHARIGIAGLMSNLPHPKIRNFYENWAMFQPTRGSVLSGLRCEALRMRAYQDIYFETQDSIRLHGWYFPGDPAWPTAIFAHGNYGNMNDREELLKAFMKYGVGIFIFNYRGFGFSGGRPSEEGLYLDFQAASRYLAEQFNIPVTRQIAMGESIGGAVAIDAAYQQALSGGPSYYALALFYTFTSIPDVYHFLKRKYPFVRWVLTSERTIRQRFNSLEKIAQISCPIFMAQGDQDLMVPLSMNHKLYAQAVKSPLKQQLIIPGGNHDNMFYIAPDRIMQELIAFLDKVAIPV